MVHSNLFTVEWITYWQTWRCEPRNWTLLQHCPVGTEPTGVISLENLVKSKNLNADYRLPTIPMIPMSVRPSHLFHYVPIIVSSSPDLNLTPLAAFSRFCRAQRGLDRNLPLFVRWVRHKNVSHPNHSMSATILSTCYASTENLGVSELNDANIKSFSVPGRISRAVEYTNFTTIVFTLPHIMVPKFANQLPIRNVGRTCNGSGNVWNWESRSRCTGTLENTAPHKILCDNFFYNFAAWRCSRLVNSVPA